MPLAAPPNMPSIRQSSMITTPPAITLPPVMRMPIMPVSMPLKLMLRMRTVLRTSPAPKLLNGIEAVNLAVERGLGDGAGKGLARRGAAAGIGVVAHARHPGARGLGVRGSGWQHERERCRGDGERQRNLFHHALRKRACRPPVAQAPRAVAQDGCRRVHGWARRLLKVDLRALVLAA